MPTASILYFSLLALLLFCWVREIPPPSLYRLFPSLYSPVSLPSSPPHQFDSLFHASPPPFASCTTRFYFRFNSHLKNIISYRHASSLYLSHISKHMMLAVWQVWLSIQFKRRRWDDANNFWDDDDASFSSFLEPIPYLAFPGNHDRSNDDYHDCLSHWIVFLMKTALTEKMMLWPHHHVCSFLIHSKLSRIL